MAGYLLDSHAFLWAKTDPEKFRAEALAEIARKENALYVSLAGLWELAIKAASGRLGVFERLAVHGPERLFAALRESGITLLPIELPHVLIAAMLPLHHRDPFDRLIIAQAQSEDLTVVTRDRIFARYGVKSLRA